MKNRHAAQSPKDILNDLHALVAEAEKMVGDTLTEHTEEAVSSLRERFAAAQERFSEIYSVAKKKVVAGAKVTDEAIRTHPYQSIAIAMGAGLLVGVLVGRRCNNS